MSGRLFERDLTAAQEDEWTALQKELTAARKVIGRLFERESTAAWKVSGQFCDRESTAALKWLALRQRGVTAIGSLIERLDRALD